MDVSQTARVGARTHSLLARFFFPVGLLRDTHGDAYLQRSMLLNNIEALRRWMPHYVKVHAVLVAMLAAMFVVAFSNDLPDWLMVLTSVPLGLESMLTIVFAGVALAVRLPAPHGY
jgi:hypothetical protein